MDLLSFINHLQKKIISGGPSKRVHGIGQGHDASVVDTLAGDPSADLPTDAAAGYMNADMLDGYHAKQVYQGKVPGLYSGLNADTLDGVDKSLGHVEASGSATAATVEITFTGTPKQTDSLSVKVYKPDGTELGSGLTVNINQPNPTLTDVANAVKAAIGNDQTILAAFVDSGTVAVEKVTLTTAETGPRANLYLVVVSVTQAPQSTLATDKSHGVYRFSGGGPEGGINADKLDDYHARETYHNLVLPNDSGINADTLDSYHAVVPNDNGKYVPRVLEGTFSDSNYVINSFNPRLIGEAIKGSSSYGWVIRPGMFGGGTSNGVTFSGGIPEFVAADVKADGTMDWAWVIRTFNNHPSGGSTNWDATSWEQADDDARGYLRWVANGAKYKGTYVDRAGVADVANSLDGVSIPSETTYDSRYLRFLTVSGTIPTSQGGDHLYVTIPTNVNHIVSVTYINPARYSWNTDNDLTRPANGVSGDNLPTNLNVVGLINLAANRNGIYGDGGGQFILNEAEYDDTNGYRINIAYF